MAGAMTEKTRKGLNYSISKSKLHNQCPICLASYTNIKILSINTSFRHMAIPLYVF